MKITDRIARGYEDFKNKHDRYPKRILMGKKAFSELLEELRHSEAPDYIYSVKEQFVTYQSASVTQDEGLKDSDISIA